MGTERTLAILSTSSRFTEAVLRWVVGSLLRFQPDLPERVARAALRGFFSDPNGWGTVRARKRFVGSWGGCIREG